MTPRNLLNISKNFSFIALMSLGETLVIISGGIFMLLVATRKRRL